MKEYQNYELDDLDRSLISEKEDKLGRKLTDIEVKYALGQYVRRVKKTA